MQTQSLTTPNTPTLLTIRQFVQRHQAFTQGGLRYLIFNADTNGMNRCLRRIGRRVLIDEVAFFEWVSACQKVA